MQKIIMDIYQTMLAKLGPQHWWPGESPIEIAIGAILTQNTSWKNVEKAIDNLKDKNMLSMQGILNMDDALLMQLIRPSGFYRQKAKRLKHFLLWLDSKGGCLKRIKENTYVLRRELLHINGIGEETADSILLYAMNRPVFVVDAYTRRILKRHDIIKGTEKYGEIQHIFLKNLPPDVSVYNEYHALIVKVGKDYCRKIPACDNCPLSIFL